jgi:hypothetical protein
MDFQQRDELIHKEFVVKMGKMYLPPKSCQDLEAKQMYGQELRKVINQRMSSNIPNAEVFLTELGKVWDRCVADNSYRIWFTPALVAKHASKVNAEYLQRQQAVDKQWERLSSPSNDEKPRPHKCDAAAQGWTIEKCDAHIADLQRMVRDGEMNRGIANLLMKIPQTAKERLTNQTESL